MSTVDEFRVALRRRLDVARKSGMRSIEINAGDLHRQLGGYPGPGHRMPVCCQAMYDEMQPGDVVVAQPPKGKGASLTIRYELSRPSRSSNPARPDEDQESQRILDRVSRETSADASIFGRTADRAKRHLSASDVDKDDWAEYWGTRIGRGIGFAVTVAILAWLLFYLLGG